MISVAMTTYNGEKYIIKQLETIRNQTLVPDEVIICDDGSKDATAQLVNDYITGHDLKGWTLVINEQNLGFAENFKQAIRLTHGDIIFLADQDDEWKPEKIEIMAGYISNNPRISSLACSLSYIDQNSNPFSPQKEAIWGEMSKKFDRDQLIQIDFLDICSTNISPGCTMCFRRKLAEKYIQSTYEYSIPHDWLINLIAAADGGLFFLNKKLIKYRIHPNNVIGMKTASKSHDASEQVDRLHRLASRYYMGNGSAFVDKEQVDKNIKYIEYRITFYLKRNLLNYLKMIKASLSTKKMYKNIFFVDIKDFMYLLHLIY